MASWPPKKNTAFIFYVGLVSQADTKTLKASPTLAANDVKVAVDDAAPANLTTLPAFDADFTKRVKVSLSAAEMNGDRISVVFADAAGAEWCDLIIDIPTSVRQTDDLAFPVVSGRGVDVDATGGVEITVNQDVNVANWKGAVAPAMTGDAYARLGAPTGASTAADIAAVKADTAAVLLDTGTDGVVVAAASKTGYALSAAGVQAIWDALTTALITAGSIGKRLVDYLTGDIFARIGAPAGASVSADVAAVKGDTAAILADTGTDGVVLPQAQADKVWASAARTLTSLGASLVAEIWNALTSGMITASSIGKKLADWVLGTDNKAMLSANAQTGVTIPTVTTVTNPVTVDTNNDKTGYSIGAGGFPVGGFAAGAITDAAVAADAETAIANAVKAIVVESQGSITLQQAISIVLAALAGVTTDGGATLKTPNGLATRIAATINASNERTVMTLTPSA